MTDAQAAVFAVHPLPWEWIDLGEVVDANNECIVECDDEALGELITSAVNALAKARAA